ncbi:two-component sensor histidine kinase [Bradyrhizobium sp. USDA 4369]
MQFVCTPEHHFAIVRAADLPCDGGDIGVLSDGSVQAADRCPAFRLLRHHIKNALQRIISQCETSALRSTPSGAALADDILRRILLSAEISDALFGFTAPPAGFERRFSSLVRATIALLSDCDQAIQARVQVAGHCPAPIVPVVLQVGHELVGNAVRHGMHMRATGTILVSLRVSSTGHVRLTVSDDGWGPGGAGQGEGGAIIKELIAPYRGSANLTRRDGLTVADISIPAKGV